MPCAANFFTVSSFQLSFRFSKLVAVETKFNTENVELLNSIYFSIVLLSLYFSFAGVSIRNIHNLNVKRNIHNLVIRNVTSIKFRITNEH